MSARAVQRDEASAPFFDAAATGTLLVKACPACSQAALWDRARCPRCASGDLEWRRASGAGTLVSWNVEHAKPAAPGEAGQTAIFGLVELEEGGWAQARLVDVGVAELHEGLALRVAFLRPGDGELIPVFRPAG
jgi:hypothetical protein